jgi:threonine synthase
VDRETELKMKSIFYGGFANEDETKDTIGRVYRENNYVMDPHTAVGKTISDRYRRETGDDLPTLLVATASPFKFNRSVVQAVLGETAVQDRSEFELLEKLKEISEREIPAGLRGLDRKEIRHRTVCSREEMPKVVKEILQL